MAISDANLKWYECTEWAEGDTHGGAIDTGDEITDATSENVFDNVSDAERIAGDTEYRKIFFRNENADDYGVPKIWIETQTPATNDSVAILQGGSKSVQGNDSAALTGTFTFAASDTVTATNDVSLEVRPGEKIFNSTDDANTDAKVVSAVSADGLTITLAEAYAGTTGAAKEAKLAAITGSTFVTPDAKDHGDVLTGPTLAQNESIGIWIKRVVTPAGDGYTDNSFVLKAENSA